MNTTNELLDAFRQTASLDNARALVQHVNRHPSVFSLFSEDDEGMVRNASRIVMENARRETMLARSRRFGQRIAVSR
jgi:hypothetical protein